MYEANEIIVVDEALKIFRLIILDMNNEYDISE